ncbi:nucleotide pyrophosphohydrolase [Streptomyces alkaliterrae]|uniref:Nucleotide pyrophosphohydrolase n=1 Tax=Streptomyces alkaliterrae TaxID=2213162 RepID=A0A5P0YT94_9ACTN|nr:nucleotide pyrophosphohydrolase [Streptomyces alkaliterrae]MBB1252783.1 nucleotide pyrophosphohydrolase [Streptomyces alkaliterrae]MBB1259148.1 nucleotide pyrophosphohydrolase [Streptomyces alkaliterrae]MQS01699.1 nucleotide pyrophosphohydrolase [Streptomyces alkaliterrae]
MSSSAPRPADGPRPDVDSLQKRLADFAAARDWGPYHTPKNLVAALSVEAGELVEIFQWLTPEQSMRVMDEPDQAHRVEDEIADVLAYLLQLCEVLGVDPLTALAAKIDRNELRFPAPDRRAASDRRHGGTTTN